ncbi:MAG: GntR family transcriptional regulator [Anaerolineales bacterium]|nr:GntR family transcriptional regulator [Anaerolineales bacterium]
MGSDSFSDLSSRNIDRGVPVPYHYQLRGLLRDEIAAGRWEVGDLFPSERELCETFDLSRTTVREAVNALVNEGWLYRERGHGTFVTKPKIVERWLDVPDGFMDSMSQQGYQIETEVLKLAVMQPPPKVARELRIGSTDLVILLDRRRSILNEPILLVTSYLPEKLCPSLAQEDFTQQSLYQTLREKYNRHVRSAKRFMEAVAADELEAELLAVRPGAPLVLIESTAYLEDGTPIEYFKARHRGDRTRFQIDPLQQVVPQPSR